MIPEITQVLFCHFKDCAQNVGSKCRSLELEACPMYSGIKWSAKKNPENNGSAQLGRDGESYFTPAFQIYAQAGRASRAGW